MKKGLKAVVLASAFALGFGVLGGVTAEASVVKSSVEKTSLIKKAPVPAPIKLVPQKPVRGIPVPAPIKPPVIDDPTPTPLPPVIGKPVPAPKPVPVPVKPVPVKPIPKPVPVKPVPKPIIVKPVPKFPGIPVPAPVKPPVYR